jgi:glycosyltransferase involved in cell wall biosynthesis
MAKNHEVTVLYFDIFKRKKTWHTEAKTLPARGISIENLLTYYTLNAPIHYRSISHFLKKNKIDVLIGAHPITNLLGIAAANKLPRKSRPLCVFDFNDFFPEGASLYFSNPLTKSLVRRGGEILLKKNLRSADMVTTVSSPMKEYADINKAKFVKLIPNGVNTSIFQMTTPDQQLKDELGLGDYVIGFVGTIERWFDLDMLIRVFAKITKKVPNVQLLIVGDGIKTNYLEKLKNQAKNLNISDKIVTPGFVPYWEVPRYISTMSLCTIPPIPKDLFMEKIALPNKLFQYAACGKPILTYPFPEVMRVGGNSVITFASEKEFLEKATRVLLDQKINEAGLELAKRYNWETIAETMLSVSQQRLDDVGR